jgi:2-polyprenyl-3-methyl-5-hydroxy-6-metoxy-1,4-benzoquinol methylase
MLKKITMLKKIEKSWNDFWAWHYRIEHRHSIPGIFDWDRELVDFIEHTCSLSPGMRILDLGCGGGDQAKVFAAKGYDVVGIDIAPSLIEFAAEQFDKEGLEGSFEVGDMREIDYDSEFDACVVLSGTFGFFGDEEDQDLLRSIARALKISGKTFISFLNPDQHRATGKSWCEVNDGWELSDTVYDKEKRSYIGYAFIIKKDGTMIWPKHENGYHAFETIRCYDLDEMKAMSEKAELEFVAAYSTADLSIPPKELAPEAIPNIIIAEKA